MSNTDSTEQSAISEYITKRADDQVAYFDISAMRN